MHLGMCIEEVMWGLDRVHLWFRSYQLGKKGTEGAISPIIVRSYTLW